MKEQEIVQAINSKLTEQKDIVRELFTRDNKDFVRKVLEELLACENNE